MAFKGFHLLFFIFLLFQSFSTISDAKRQMPSDKITSPFDFLDQLKGSQKGHKTKEIRQLKNYLRKFGYLNDQYQTLANHDDDHFDETLESAIKTYQKNYNLKPTGILDDETTSKMLTPRCGNPDIVNGINFMQPSERNTHGVSSNSAMSIHTVSHYTFFPRSPKWPSSKSNLTYGFSPNTSVAAMGSVARAFAKWASSTQFRFSQAAQNPDLVIGFFRLSHGDGSPFDGPGGTLAHAFAPTDGRLHYDGDERWAVGAVRGSFDMETVALHEIGHLLGLGHSSVQEAIMYPSIASGTTKNLSADDIQGIKALYNV